MKKRFYALLSLLLVLSLLTGCAGQAAEERTETFGGRFVSKSGQTIQTAEQAMLSFDAIPYTRPELDTLRTLLDDAEEALTAGESFREITKRLDLCMSYYDSYYTMYILADIRSCQDITDAYYAGEYDWCGENYALVQQMMDELYYASAASPMADRLEKDYFWPGFVEQYSDSSQSMYSDTMVELLQQENALLTEYRALTAEPTLDWDGREVDFLSLLSELAGEDYNAAVTAYYQKYNETFADLYIRLVRVRCRMAEELGYDSYEQMQYEYGYDRDYTPAQAQAYLADIKTYVVPFYRSLMDTDPYGDVWYDLVDEELLYDILAEAAGEIGGEVEEAFAFMSKYELYDIAVSPKKASMSFQTYLTDYKAPFLFLDAQGDTEDILSFAHEFGHFCDAYVNEDAYETTDLAECYSQAMEYLVLNRLKSSLWEEDVQNVARLKMLDTLELYVQQAAYAEFEHQVYALGPDQLSAETLNELARQAAKDYGYYDGGYDAFYSMSWVDISHFFEMPFYVISYPVSNDIAMQLYEMEQAEEGSGMAKYLEVLPRDFTGLMELVDAGGFEDPFAPGRLQKITASMRHVFES